jgi:hypothetical protein
LLCAQETLNMFLGMGRPAWKEARATLQKILSGFDFLFVASLLRSYFTAHTIGHHP